MNCSPQGFSFHGILQARILEWVAISFSRESNPGLLHCRIILHSRSHLGIPSLYNKWFTIFFFPILYLLNRFFHKGKVLNSDGVQFISLSFYGLCFGVKCKNYSPSLRSQSFSPAFLESFIVLRFAFKPMVPFELIFVKGMRLRLRGFWFYFGGFFFLYGYSVGLTPLIKSLSFLHRIAFVFL